MSEHKLNWKAAELEEGRLTVPIDPPPDEDWRMAFGMALGVLDVETRGQQFSGWHVGDDALALTGVMPEALKPTADFFDTVVKQADAELARPRRDRAQVQDDPPKPSAADEQAALDELRQRD